MIDIYYLVEGDGTRDRHRIWGQAVRFEDGTWVVRRNRDNTIAVYAYDPPVSKLDPEAPDLILVRLTSVPDPAPDLKALERDGYPDGTPFASLAEAARYREQQVWEL